MRILIFGDVHVCNGGEFSKRTDDGLTTHLHSVLDSCEWLCNQIRKEVPDAVVNLGDLFDGVGSVNESVLYTATQFVDQVTCECNDIDARYIHILGNHDYRVPVMRDKAIPFLVNGTLVTEPTFDKPRSLACYPYVRKPDMDDVKSSLSSWFADGCKAVFTHLDFKGARLQGGSSQVEEKGIDLGGVSGGLIFNGHYHLPHTITFGRGKTKTTVVNVGCLVAKNFADMVEDESHGIVIYDTETGEIRRVPNPHTKVFRDVTVVEAPMVQDMDRTCIRLHYPESDKEIADSLAPLFSGCRPVPQIRSITDETETDGETDDDVVNRYISGNLPDDKGLADAIMAVKDNVLLPLKEKDGDTVHRDVFVNEIRIKNFSAIGEATVNPSSGMTLVLGENKDELKGSTGDSNGAGKSSVFESILWCFYGNSPKGNVDEVINDNADYCFVEVDVTVNGDSYTIGRYREHDDYGTGVRIILNESEVHPEGTQDANREVERILGLDYDSFCRVVFLRPDLMGRFMDLKPAERTRLLEEVFGLQVYDSMSADARGKKSDANNNVNRIGGKVETASGYVVTNESSLARAKEELDEARATGVSTADIDKQRAEIAEKIAEYRDAAVALTDVGDGISDEIGVLDEKIDMVSSSVGSLEAKIRELMDSSDGYDRKATSIRSEIRALEGQRREQQRLALAGKCPVCGTDTGAGECGGRIEQAISDLKDRIDSLAESVIEWDDKVATVGETISTLRDKNTGLASSLREYQQQRSRLTVQRNDSRNEIESKRRKLSNAIASLEEEDRELQQVSDREKRRIAVAEERVKAAKERVSSSKKELKEAQEELKQADLSLGVWSWWASTLSTDGLRNKILQTRIGYMNNWLSTQTQRVWTSGKVKIVHVRGTKIGVSVGKRKYENHSSGERRKTDILIQLLINHLIRNTLGVSVHLMVCDEVFDTLDKTSLQVVLGMAEEVLKGEPVYVTSHNDLVKGYFNKSITVVKEDGVASVQE